MGRGMTYKHTTVHRSRRSCKGTDLGMFLGSDGGILGVGAPEAATILLVGYFILGPTELFKLTKEIGKFIQNFRTLGSEATKSFESTMENQLELTELRKAQSELNQAFNFRRSINVDAESEAFSELPPIAESASAVAGTATVTATDPEKASNKKRKKKRRRVKKKKIEVPEEENPLVGGDIPDLDMTSAFQDEFKDQMGIKSDIATNGPNIEESESEMSARLRRERLERLEQAQARSNRDEKEKKPTGDQDPDWFSASESDIASEVLAKQPTPAEVEAANNRFANQLSGKWNENVLDNEDKLSPLAMIMDQLAILEEERAATTLRLDEEFVERAAIEEKFYREKREVLEIAAGEISAAAYSNFDFGESDKNVTETDELSKKEEKSKTLENKLIGQKTK